MKKGSRIFITSLIIISFFTGTYANAAKLKTEKKTETIGDMWQPNFDELMNTRWTDLLDSRLSNYFPRMNIQETPENYHLEAELPGVKKDEIDVKLKDDYLVISGEKKSFKEETKNQYRRIERSDGAFYRAVSIPRNIDRDKITASLKDGILFIDIAKTKVVPAVAEKKILVQ